MSVPSPALAIAAAFRFREARRQHAFPAEEDEEAAGTRQPRARPHRQTQETSWRPW